MKITLSLLILAFARAVCAAGDTGAEIIFQTGFEGGSLGKVERLAEGRFRCHIVGQADERGRNRQANWYFFRIDGLKQRAITLLLTNFVGEYNDRPGSCAMNADTIPVFSLDGQRWHHFPEMGWDDAAKEASLKLTPQEDSVWIAHVPPYVPTRLQSLLKNIERRPGVSIEVIGQTVEGRDLHLVTVSEAHRREGQPKTVWLIARQHAWETGTSFVMEGALQFITSKDPAAAALRKQVVFKFLPMMDPDGSASGKVRFNAFGYDVNRHWDKVNPRDGQWAGRMPEIWSAKRSILDWLDAGNRIDLMVNMHNTESTEYLQGQVDVVAAREQLRHFSDVLTERTTFAPSRPLSFVSTPSNSTLALWKERAVPVLLMEQRVGFNPKLQRRPTVEDRLAFGRELIVAMAQAALREPARDRADAAAQFAIEVVR
jgi:hypothetical protein